MTLKRHAGIRLLRMTNRASWGVESKQPSGRPGLSLAAPASPVKALPKSSLAITPYSICLHAFDNKTTVSFTCTACETPAYYSALSEVP